MITHTDQLGLFRLISQRIKKDIACYAFGGNAMMFYGYKAGTKDVDLCFENSSDRLAFAEAAEDLGFAESSPFAIYRPEKLRDKNRPLIYKRLDYRLDLFSRKIFRSVLSPAMRSSLFAVHEFKGNKKLVLKVLGKEHIAYLKGITDRKNDFEDIRTILEKDKDFDWQRLADEAVWQHEHGDSWAVLDTERMMKEMKKHVMIEKRFFDELYRIH